MSEDNVFDQDISPEELENVAGGSLIRVESEAQGCRTNQARDIYEGGFPNCAATVEDDSFCYDNDACFKGAVVYQHMESCLKAWR